MGASILDVSVGLVGETPVKTKPTPSSPKSVSQDFIRHLGKVTPKQGRANAATPISHYIVRIFEVNLLFQPLPSPLLSA